jgi:hypothetical protein
MRSDFLLAGRDQDAARKIASTARAQLLNQSPELTSC